MRVDFFEKVKTWTHFIMSLVLLVSTAAIVSEDPHLIDLYQIDAPFAQPYKVAQCDAQAVRGSSIKKTRGGYDAWVVLCFAATQAPDGVYLIPHQSADEGTVLRSRYTPEIENYVNQTENEFVWPDEDAATLTQRWWSAKIHTSAIGLGYVALLLLLIFITSKFVTWVVREMLQTLSPRSYGAAN